MGIKDFFFKPEEPKEVLPSNNVPQQEVIQNAIQPISNTTGSINQDLYKQIKQIITENNIPGDDYLELKNASNAMSGVIPDESSRFIAAFASMKANSPKLNKTTIINSIDEYVKIIQKERTSGVEDFNSLMNKEITSRQNHVADSVKKIEDLKAKITEFQQTIIEESQKINSITSEMNAKQIELSNQKSSFDATFDMVENELKSDKVKLQTIIPE